jgi:hypothetical protein
MHIHISEENAKRLLEMSHRLNKSCSAIVNHVLTNLGDIEVKERIVIRIKLDTDEQNKTEKG